MAKHPRDTFITLYGRKPVLEALSDDSLEISKVLIANNAQGSVIDRIVAAARDRGVKLERGTPKFINRISRNARHDQGVVVDVVNRRMRSLQSYIESEPERATLLALDNVTTPANVGMILRTATALGIDGVILPRQGCPEVSPLVIKASAGVALRAPILRCLELPGALRALQEVGFECMGLHSKGNSLERVPRYDLTVFVLGNESEGISHEVNQLIGTRVHIPMSNGVDSLNVAAAAAILCYAIRR